MDKALIEGDKVVMGDICPVPPLGNTLSTGKITRNFFKSRYRPVRLLLTVGKVAKRYFQMRHDFSFQDCLDPYEL